MRPQGMDRVHLQKEKNRRERQQQREVVQECRKGNLSRFQSYVKPLGEMNAQHHLGVSLEEFRKWDKATK